MTTNTLDSLLQQLPEQPTEPKTCTVDLSDLLGEGWQFSYREPNLADFCATTDSRVLSQWERIFPNFPQDILATLELIARLHISPPSAQIPVGRFYAELLQKLPPNIAITVLRRISDTISTQFQLNDLTQTVEQKKTT